MNNRERFNAIMNYQDYDKMPVMHFGFWKETHDAWFKQGHLTEEELKMPEPQRERHVAERLGFTLGLCWTSVGIPGLMPTFERKVIEELPDGSRKVQNTEGVVILESPGVTSIPSEFDHLLKDRKSWEEHYLPRLKFTESRIDDKEGIEKARKHSLESVEPVGHNCGSAIGIIRNWIGVENLAYMYMDDPELLDEIIETFSELSYKILKIGLENGIKVDHGCYWEDICFKNGPLVSPSFFAEKCGPVYKKKSELLKKYGVNLSLVDCDGCIDSLIDTWVKNGVNIMFPIEVGTWSASIKPWREKYGREIRGMGGMDKKVFAMDYKAIDVEIERLKPLVELGGFIPCPDHRIPPESKWENVQYYCERMKETF